MVNPTLLAYIKAETAKGVSKESIRSNLTLGGGWSSHDIEEAFGSLDGNNPMANPALDSVPQKYAGFWIRFVAAIIDGWVSGIGAFIVLIVIGIIEVVLHASTQSLAIKIINNISSLVVCWIYFVLMTHYKNATLGKMAVGLVVKSDDNQKLPLGRIIIRETIGKILSAIILYIGYIMAGFTKKKQALHDKMANSVVVYKNAGGKTNVAVVVAVVVFGFFGAMAIIGILSSIVLASLNVARAKGGDARTESVMSEMRAEAEVYSAENNDTYSVADNCSSGMFADPGFVSISSLLKDTSGMSCFAEGTSYAVSIPLSTATDSFCVDSTGYAGNGLALDHGSDAVCQQSSSK